MKVPEPRKLKSGNWFIQMRLDGVSVPVTAATKKECISTAQLIKAEYRAGKRVVAQPKQNDTPGELLDRYIIKYESVLSPSTIRGYSTIRKNRFPKYMDLPIYEIKDWQLVINEELKSKSEHTVKNGWGALTAAFGDAGIPVPKVKLAKVPEHDLAFLEPEEIEPFCKAIEGDIAEVAILLELHGLRESEAMAVIRKGNIDLKHNTIIVQGAIVPNKNHQYVDKKTNKTATSTRNVPIMIPRLSELAKVPGWNKELAAITILKHVHAACERANVTDVTNHGLRRTFASLGYSLGVPERIIMALGGWDEPSTVHKVYIKLASRDKDKSKTAYSDFFAAFGTAPDLHSDAISELTEFIETYASLRSAWPHLFAEIDMILKENANKNANNVSKTQ